MDKAFQKLFDIINKYTTGIPFLVWSVLGISLASFVFVFRHEENVKFTELIYSFVFAMAWFVVSEVMKRIGVLKPKAHFVMDSVFYLFIYGLIFYYTGGLEGHLLFIFFFASISAPIFYSLPETFIFLLFLAVVEFSLYFYMEEKTEIYQIGVLTLSVIFYFATAVIMKFFQESYLNELKNAKIYEEKLVEAKKLPENILKRLREFLMVADKNGGLIMVNDFFLKNLGYEEYEAIGKQIGVFVKAKDKGEIGREAFRVCAVEPMDMHLVTKRSGYIPIRAACSFLDDGAGGLNTVVFGHDLRLERKLHKMKATADKLEKMNKALVGRELRMRQLKKEIKELKGE